jgi:transcriptional regulator with XRE-family HTH domain
MPAISPIHTSFGQALRELRKEQGVSQEGLALKGGLDRAYYGGIERGERNVSLTNVAKLARAGPARLCDPYPRRGDRQAPSKPVRSCLMGLARHPASATLAAFGFRQPCA